MDLERVAHEDIAGMRQERLRISALPIVPRFHTRLAEEAEAFLIVEPREPGETPRPLGYALLLERPHGVHSHVTLIELYLDVDNQTRYEDALDLIREQLKPTAYLARTDDCRLNAALLARGLQVEATALVMLPEAAAPPASGSGSSGLRADAGAPSSAGVEMDLTLLTAAHLTALRELLGAGDKLADGHRGDGTGDEPSASAHDHHVPDPAQALAELETLAGQGRNWVLLHRGQPVAVIARLEGGDGEHELLDFAIARAGEAELAGALRQATDIVRTEGGRPAAVIDAAEAARRRIFRAAGYYSAAAYMVFYDPEAGRPSVGTVSVDELRAMTERKEQVRLVDVLGEEHWNKGHLPGSEWIDFRGLAREARRRFASDEPLVLYCNGFT
jgi:hypothetical protein